MHSAVGPGYSRYHVGDLFSYTARVVAIICHTHNSGTSLAKNVLCTLPQAVDLGKPSKTTNFVLLWRADDSVALGERAVAAADLEGPVKHCDTALDHNLASPFSLAKLIRSSVKIRMMCRIHNHPMEFLSCSTQLTQMSDACCARNLWISGYASMSWSTINRPRKKPVQRHASDMDSRNGTCSDS